MAGLPPPRSDVCLHGTNRKAVGTLLAFMFINFLPTGTIVTFEMLLPFASGDGTCTHASTMMINILLLVCAGLCVFYRFTDSFCGPDGIVHYGFVTQRGLVPLKSGPVIYVPDDARYKMTISDLVRALMSVIAFAAITCSDQRVEDCLFPGYKKDMDDGVMDTFLLLVAAIGGLWFVVFPISRKGIRG